MKTTSILAANTITDGKEQLFIKFGDKICVNTYNKVVCKGLFIYMKMGKVHVEDEIVLNVFNEDFSIKREYEGVPHYNNSDKEVPYHVE